MAQENNGKGEKLSYDKLEAYVNQTTLQAKRIYKENEELLKEINELKSQRNYYEITLAFKMLEHKEFFSEECLKKVAARLEEVLTPVDPPKDEEVTENKEE